MKITTTKTLCAAAIALLLHVTVSAQGTFRIINTGATPTVTTKPATVKPATTTVKKVSTTTVTAKPATKSPASTATKAPATPKPKPVTITGAAKSTSVKPAASTSAKKASVKPEASASAKTAATPSVATTLSNDELYTKAVGLRAGETSGITYKHFFTDVEAIEGILGLWPNAMSLTGLYEKYVPFGSVKGLNWYFGGGAHLSIGTGKLYYFNREGNRYYKYRHDYPGLAVGVDGIIGIEYKIPRAPFALSFDLKPFLEVNNGGIIYTSFDPGLGIKVAF